MGKTQPIIHQPDTGPKPELRWIDKRLLTIEPYYQRSISSNRGLKLIAKIAANWYWAHASVLIVAKKGELWTIIDGQHRHQASLRRPDIKDLPCLIVTAASLGAQAKAFLAHNDDRITLGSLAIFHARFAGGDEIATAVIRACADNKIEVRRTNTTVDMLKANETMATGAMSEIVKSHGVDHLSVTLNVLRESYPATKGQLRSHTMKAVAAIIAAHPDARPKIVLYLKKITGLQLEDMSRNLRHEGFSIPQGYVVTIAQGCGIEIDAKKALAKKKPPPPPKEPKPKKEPKPPKEKKKPTPKKAERGRPFHFDRSKPAKIKKPVPVIVNKGPVQVRRFEPGDTMSLIERALALDGHVIEKIAGKNRATPFKVGHRKFNLENLIKFADEIRKRRKLPPISK